jgi:hypothetical protein
LRKSLPVLRLRRRAPVIASAIACAFTLVPSPVSAEGFFDFFLNGAKQLRAAVPQSSSLDPFNNNPPGPPQPRAVVSSGSGPAFCVRSCDGKYFPLMRASASPVAMCQSFCPASPTKVYFGSSIDGATSQGGERYADSENAYAYRKALRADCTCNGRDPAGLAPVDLTMDTSLRPGDVIATTNGLVAFSGVRVGNDQTAEFTPVASYPGLTAEVRARLGDMKVSPVSSEVAASDVPASLVHPTVDPMTTGSVPRSTPTPVRGKRVEMN